VNSSEIIDGITSFSKDNPIIALVVGLLLLFLLVRKTKLFLLLCCIALILAAAHHFIMDTSSVGRSAKEKMIQRGIEPTPDNRR
jgi:hypothetical protein